MRRYRHRDEADVIRQYHSDRRVIDEATWETVQARLRDVHAHYAKDKDGNPKGRSVPGRSTPYLFSSLLFCGECGGRMVISGGSGGNAYYRCEAYNKRGTCKNALSVREAVVRQNLLDEIRHRLVSSEGVQHARKVIAERLGQVAHEGGQEARASVQPREEQRSVDAARRPRLRGREVSEHPRQASRIGAGGGVSSAHA